MASATVDITNAPYKRPIHEMSFYNATDTTKAIKVLALIDTGSIYNILDTKYATQLGFSNYATTGTKVNISDSFGNAGTPMYGVNMLIRVAPALKPIKSIVYFRKGDGLDNVFGSTSMYYYYNVRFSKTKITYQELAQPKPQVEKQAALAMLQTRYSYRNRI